MRASILASVLAALVLCAFLSKSPLFVDAIDASPLSNDEVKQVVTVVLLGATGDLAAKYLWVAMFRMALEAASTSNQMFKFIGGASNSLQKGREWHEKFFNDDFAERVCGTDHTGEKIARRSCLKFLEQDFKSNVNYTPLRSEDQYRNLGNVLEERNLQLQDGSREIGRIVYLAIPPQSFLQSCEWIHQHLRARSGNEGDPFLRVVVEKPFGRDQESAHELAARLRRIYNDKELYVMDHYAGKPVVHALRRYFQQNAAALHPFWNTEFIREIQIEMNERATVENRVNYFDSAGIIRDMMVNHLQLLLNVAVSPSFNAEGNSLHEAQLRFMNSLKWDANKQERSLFVAQYEEYAEHYRREFLRDHDNGTFTPTAAMIKLTSTSKEWRNTTFQMAAAKATDSRLLAITVTFRDGVFGDINPCTFTVTIQLEKNAAAQQSRRMAWSCDVEELLQLPEGWEYLLPHAKRVLIPSRTKQEHAVWELGDERSAYDILLRKVAVGATEHFAALNEIEAAWVLWTPIVNAAESMKQEQAASYPTGTSPWKEMELISKQEDIESVVKEEL